jgi:hypothetical protein
LNKPTKEPKLITSLSIESDFSEKIRLVFVFNLGPRPLTAVGVMMLADSFRCQVRILEANFDYWAQNSDSMANPLDDNWPKSITAPRRAFETWKCADVVRRIVAFAAEASSERLSCNPRRLICDSRRAMATEALVSLILIQMDAVLGAGKGTRIGEVLKCSDRPGAYNPAATLIRAQSTCTHHIQEAPGNTCPSGLVHWSCDLHFSCSFGDYLPLAAVFPGRRAHRLVKPGYVMTVSSATVPASSVCSEERSHSAWNSGAAPDQGLVNKAVVTAAKEEHQRACTY